MSTLPVPPDSNQGRLERIDFHGDTIEAVWHDGKVWVSVLRICESLGIDRKGQQDRLKAAPWAVGGLFPLTAADGKKYETYCILLDSLPMWLATIDTNRVGAHVRPKLKEYQCEAADALRRYFFEGQATNPRSKQHERYRRLGKSEKWIEVRTEAVEARKTFTDVLQQHGVAGSGYPRCTDAINKRLLGGTAKEMKARMGLPKSANLRDALPLGKLFQFGLTECLAAVKIERDEARGNAACEVRCDTVAARIAGAVSEIENG